MSFVYTEHNSLSLHMDSDAFVDLERISDNAFSERFISRDQGNRQFG